MPHIRPAGSHGHGEGGNADYAKGLRKSFEYEKRWRRVGIQDRFQLGYRICLGSDGDRLIFLFGGGTKKPQQKDISDALARWQD